METLSIQLLPEYTPSTPAPDYSSKLLPGEKCIQKSPRLTQPHADNVSFTYRERGMTLTLKDCRKEDRHPTFGLGSTIRGEVALDHRQRVVAVAAKLEGRVYLPGQPSKVVNIVSKERTLWESSTLGSFRGECAADLMHPETDTIIFREAHMSIHLRYRPRVRPSRPVPDCFSELKQSPEDWMEDVWVTKPSVDTGNDAFLARCHFFFPSVRVFTASEKIPFHLRLETSPLFLRSLAKLFLPQQNPSAIEEVNVQGTTFSREDVLGRGQMMLQSSCTSKAVLSESEEPVTWSWNGDLRCDVPVLSTGFTTSQVSTSDYIVLSLLLPPGPLRSDLSLQRTIPIRLATEPWIDRS
ncbi:hypothetical protein DFH29DRAFT_874214 [Suillus ampliporus]|nr:hypothetical protein DFH29DRAFT_874214 [Suillus ampliporus]